VAAALRDRSDPRRLAVLEQALRDRSDDLAVFLVFDRPWLVAERPALARTHFAERCAPDRQIERMLEAFRSTGAHAQLFEGDHQFLAALAQGENRRLGRELQIAYNGLGYSVGPGAFQPGRKSLVPLIADSYGLACANSDPYACTFTLHKFHCFTLLRELGVMTPRTWQYRPGKGWMGESPSPGTKVIVKSTYEAWAVGVTQDSVFVVDESCDARVAEIAAGIGQAVTVQEFIAGPEVYVPVVSCPEIVVAPPVESVLTRAPGDGEAVVTIDDNLSDEAITYRRFDGGRDLDDRLRKCAREIFDLLELQGLARIDFRIDAAGQPWVFDIGISPGMEARGSAAVSLAEYGFEYPAFVRLVIAATLATRGVLGV
jgi:D-alanine-D-alanine ligase